MRVKDFLQTKKGASIEILFFLIVAISMTSVLGSGLILYPLALTSLGIRKIEWHQIGLIAKDFNIKKIGLGIGIAIVYHYADLYFVDPIMSKFSNSSLPEIFSMKGDVTKLVIGLTLSWTTAAFLEEIVFRGYLINRFIDLIGDSLGAKILIVLITGITFGFVHSYQGLSGAISAGFIGLLQAIVYFIFKNKLTIPIIAHGTYDTIGFTLLFIG